MIANEPQEGGGGGGSPMEHHTMERPRVAAGRRRPTVVSMTFEVSPLKNIDINEQGQYKGVLKDKGVFQNLSGQLNENSSRFLNTKASVRSLTSSPSKPPRGITPRSQKVANEFSSSPDGKAGNKEPIRKKESTSKLHPETVVVEASRESVKPLNKLRKRAPRTYPKWVQVFGFPMTADQVEGEKQRVAELARKQGASKEDIQFMLKQILPMNDQILEMELNRGKVEFLRGRLLLGAVRGVDDTDVKGKTLMNV